MACSCVRILDTNWIDIDILANTDVSSENPSFPVVNAYNLQRRSKVWRSRGYWNITATNNGIVFNDGAGNTTASIAVAEYNSAASFMTAIDTALEAVGLANYTVTQDSDCKFVITSDLSGGATIFSLITTSASFTSAALLGFDTAANKTGASSYTADLLINHEKEFITWDMGVSSKPSAFAMIGSRNSGIKLSPSGVFKLKGNFSNDFTTPDYSTTLEYHDEVISTISDTTLSTTGYRYWQIEFVDQQNPNCYVEIGALFLGTYWEPLRGNATYPLQSEFVDRSITVFSEGGQSFTDILPQSQRFSIKWDGLLKEDIESITEIFRKYGTGKPFFIQFDSTESFTTEYQRMLKFVKFENEPKFALTSFNLFECTMELREEL